MSDRAAAVASLERVRDKLMETFDNDRASFTPWAFELLSIVETALGTTHRDGLDDAGKLSLMSESQEALIRLAKQFARVGTEKLDTPVDDSSGCTHPADGVMWNEFNKATQCHRCGALIDGADDVR